MKKLVLLTLIFLTFSSYGNGILRENLSGGSLAIWDADTVDSTQLEFFQGYSINKYLDTKYEGVWGWQDVLMVGGGKGRIDYFAFSGSLIPYYKNNSIYTPYFDLTYGYEFASDIFSDYYISNLPDSEWYREWSLGTEVDLNRFNLPVSLDISMGNIKYGDFGGVDFNNLNIYWWLKEKSAIQIGRTSYDTDSTITRFGYISGF